MIRQYRLVTKTPDSEEQILEPGVHAAIYNIPAVREAVTFLETSKAKNVEMIGVRIGFRFYGIIVIWDVELRPHHFTLRDFSKDA